MCLLIMVCGFSGSGKTRATEYLADNLPGERLYLGGKILDLVRQEGLPETRESERQVRLALRERDGIAALAMMEQDRIRECLLNKQSVVIDAVFAAEEVSFLRGCAEPYRIQLIGIESSFEKRCERLAMRPQRPLTSEELRKRDKTEAEILGLPAVMQMSDITIENSDSLQSYENKLQDLVSTLKH